jgi:phage terminase large subunit
LPAGDPESIEESSYQELIEEIERRDLGDSFVTGKKVIRVPATRSSFSFPRAVPQPATASRASRSLEGMGRRRRTASRASRGKSSCRRSGSRLRDLVTFNPNKEATRRVDRPDRPLRGELLDEDGCYEDDEVLIIRANYTDNPWFTDELELERAKMERTDKDRYNWIWLGKFNKRSDEIIFAGKYRVEAFETPPGVRFFFGADWGFAQDPTTLNRSFVRGNTLYIDYEAHGVHTESTDIWKLFAGREGAKPAQLKEWTPEDTLRYPGIPGARKWKIKADSARPETISQVARQGFNIDAAKKWGGSVEDGIEVLRGFDEIVIHPRCVHTIAEFGLYSYKVDKLTGDILPIIVDKHNHHIDGIRYSLDGYIRGRGQGIIISAEALQTMQAA